MYSQLDCIAVRLIVRMPVEEIMEGHYISQKDAYYAVKPFKSSYGITYEGNNSCFAILKKEDRCIENI